MCPSPLILSLGTIGKRLTPHPLHSLPLISWVLLLAILEDRSDVAFLQSLGTSNHRGHSKLFKCGLVVTTASTHGCIPSGPMDIDMSHWFRYSLSWPCFKKRQSDSGHIVSDKGQKAFRDAPQHANFPGRILGISV